MILIALTWSKKKVSDYTLYFKSTGMLIDSLIYIYVNGHIIKKGGGVCRIVPSLVGFKKIEHIFLKFDTML